MADNIDISRETEREHCDSIRIADDVIKCIAAFAASEIEGVAGMAGNATNDIIARLGGKTLEKGVRVTIDENEVRLMLSINVRYGCSIPEVSRKVQDKVRSTIENMTGFSVSEIDINIAGIENVIG
ncbi:MAG: Asp23/Gls24 family envelope stress response protein [Clostridiales bacterium]|nr:Asp23/Gls24 family envelope stress response protein [Clostridiales bacterium]